MRTLQHILHIMVNQLTMFTEAMGDVHAYVNTQMTSCDYVEPHITSFKSIIYRQLFDELKSLCISKIHFNKICIDYLSVFIFIFLPYLPLFI